LCNTQPFAFKHEVAETTGIGSGIGSVKKIQNSSFHMVCEVREGENSLFPYGM
jgi:hypothetical protein